MVTHPGAATAEGDMNYLEEDFDPMTGRDPLRDMPGAADAYIHYDQLNTINFTNVAQRTANVALVQQGLDPALAAQQQAIQSEANALHSEVLERHRESLVSEGRDHLTRVEKTAAEEITQRKPFVEQTNCPCDERAEACSTASSVSGSSHKGIACRT